MIIGVVSGNVWATRKDETLTGIKLLVVTLETPKENSPVTIIAADNVGAGEGDRVLLTQGMSAHLVFQDRAEKPPIDAAVIGIIDGNK